MSYYLENLDNKIRVTSNKLLSLDLYDSAQKLSEYSIKDKPSSVWRHIANQVNSYHHYHFAHMNSQYRVSKKNHEKIRDAFREFSDLPKRNSSWQFNAQLSESIQDLSSSMIDVIPNSELKQIRDNRKAYERHLKKQFSDLRQKRSKAKQQINTIKGVAINYNRDNEDIYRASAGESEARLVQSRLDLDAEQRESTPIEYDVNPENQIVFNRDDVNSELGGLFDSKDAYNLNEAEDSNFAKAVDDLYNNDKKRVSSKWIELGTTPEALISSGINDSKMVINQAKMAKIRNDHPEITASMMKRIPIEINNPVAVFKNTKRGSIENSYVILTEIQADNGDIVIIPLHAYQSQGGLVVHKVASMYGRNESARYIENMVNHAEVRYVDEQKARRVQRRLQLLEANTVNELFDKAIVLKSDSDVNEDIKKAQNLNTERLQLPWDITSDNELSKRNIKTEVDLSQYQSENNEQVEDTPQAQIDAVRKQYEGTDQWMKAPNGLPTKLTELQWLQVRTPNFKNWFGDWENGQRAEEFGRDNRRTATRARGDNGQLRNQGVGRGVADSKIDGSRNRRNIRGERQSEGTLLRTVNSQRVQSLDPETGEPRVFYHGTKDNFFVFDKTHANKKDFGWLGVGHYFTSDTSTAGLYAANKKGKNKLKAMSVYLNARNPYVATQSLKNKIRDGGKEKSEAFTAYLTKNGYDSVVLDHGEGGLEVMVLDASQIKSATDNTGEFNPDNDDIRYSRKPPERPLTTLVPKKTRLREEVRQVLLDEGLL